MTAAAASWMSAATFPEVLKRTEWHLQRGSPNIPLSPLHMFFPPCHPAFPALLRPWIYIRCSSARCPKQRAGFDIHHLLTGFSLIAAGVCTTPLPAHWQIREKGIPPPHPPAVPLRLLSVLGALLLTTEWLWRAKNNLQGHSLSSFHFASVSSHTLLPFILWAATFCTQGSRLELTPECLKFKSCCKKKKWRCNLNSNVSFKKNLL